ncbi:MAG: PAS domain-containing protein [Planctomycetes bacterium]|nr:PAS domain-containing protein [Planctomycetota bacterium]
MREANGDLVINSTPVGVMLIDRNLKILAAEPASAKSLHLKLEGVLGQHCHDVLKGESVPCLDCDIQKVFETGEPQAAIYTVRDQKGLPVTLSGEATPVFARGGAVKHVALILRNAYPKNEIKERVRRQNESLRREGVKFATKKSRGWIDVGGSRMCLLDLEGGWLRLFTTLADYAGEETAARTLFEAGAGESFTTNAFEQGLITKSAQGFRDAVDCYSEAGFGDFRIQEIHMAEGAAVITCRDTGTSWSFKRTGRTWDQPVCYYDAGGLLSFMRFASGKKGLHCVETRCVACGDEECAFYIGPRSWLKQRGVKIPEQGLTIKEKVKLTREWVGRIMGARQLIGESDAMQEVLEFIETVKDSNSPVFLEGESGTGKQLVAEAIHKQGARAGEPFVPVNCAVIPETLLESELFGHAKGAFTGATGEKPGLVEIASGGTLFIDEVCEMNLSAQVKLLNVLDTGVYRRIGETAERCADMRVVAATNRDIREEVAAGRFREDLYYRLNVIHLRIPPLRDRKDDIPLLVDHFLNQASLPSGKRKSASREFLRVLGVHDWPGNVRELANVVERAVLVSGKDRRLAPRHLPAELVEEAKGGLGQTREVKSLEEVEAEHIQKVLKQVNGNKSHAAKALGITRATLRRKLTHMGLS